MLRNRIFIKRIRNICILVMAIIIAIGIYTNVRRSRAENVIQVALQVSDKSETLAMQEVMANATETEDGNFVLNLPTAVNGNIVTKYYLADGTEIVMNDENADKTLTLTEADVTNQPIQFQTDYDKKEVTTEDGQVITLYNKELMDEKKTEEPTNNESSEENLDNETANQTENQMEDQTANQIENQMEDQTANQPENQTENQTASETVDEENTDKEPEFDDTVIVTGYMPLEAQVDVNEIDLSTLPEMTLPETQTVQKAYEVSIYQTIRRIIDANDNMISEETIMPDKLLPDETTQNVINNETENNTIIEDTTNNMTGNEIIESITSENAKENENVESVTETTTSNNTTITTILLKDGTRIEEEKIEYDPSVYNELIEIKTKKIKENTITTIYNIQENNQIVPLESAEENEYTNTSIEKKNQTVKYLIATEPDLRQDEGLKSLQTNSRILTAALTDGNVLRSTSNETSSSSGFLGNTSLNRERIQNITFVDNISGANDTAWDVSEAQDGSIMAWYNWVESGTLYQVFIGSNETIYANPDSSYLFANIGRASTCKATEVITNMSLLDTSKVENMSYMFYYTGSTAMTSLNLGDNFDTSNVTNMKSMFHDTGAMNMIEDLHLGDKFDTSNVTNMSQMFYFTGGSSDMKGIHLGDKFNTSNVTDMSQMFYYTGHDNLLSLDLGDQFDTSNVTNMSEMFNYTGTNRMTELDLGEKFDTSNVTNMSEMFYQTGSRLETLDLGDKFDTSKVTNMSGMFAWMGRYALTSLNLGNKFNTTNVTDMTSMFYMTGESYMTTLDLGLQFTKIADTNTNMFTSTGKSGENIIIVPRAIYQDNHHTKLNESSTTTIEYTRGTIKTFNYLRTTNTETSSTDAPFLGNTSIKRHSILKITFVDSLSGANSTAWDVSEAQNGSIKAWYEVVSTTVGNAYRVYIGSNDCIYANPDSSYLFYDTISEIGTSEGENINNINLLNTSDVTNMSYMFNSVGCTELDLGENFDTSNVTNMEYMFNYFGINKTNTLDLGENFDTSNVTNMKYMFCTTFIKKLE